MICEKCGGNMLPSRIRVEEAPEKHYIPVDFTCEKCGWTVHK